MSSATFDTAASVSVIAPVDFEVKFTLVMLMATQLL
jgi:hypothetical protein